MQQVVLVLLMIIIGVMVVMVHIQLQVLAVVVLEKQIMIMKVHQVVEVQNLIPMFHLQQMADQVIHLLQVLHKAMMEVVVR